MIDPQRITAFDVETAGREDLYALQPFRMLKHEAWLTTCAVATYDGEYSSEGMVVFDRPLRETAELLSAWLDRIIEHKHHVVCWNTAFDVAWLLVLGKLFPELGIRAKVFKVKWLDGLLLYRHSVNAPKFREEGRISLGLKPTVERFLPHYAGYADDVDFNDMSPEGVAKLLRYNRRDSAYTLELAHFFLASMPEDTLRNLLIEARCIPDVAETYVEGIKLNPEGLEKLRDTLEEKRRVALVTLKFDSPEVSEEILASSTKLSKLMYDSWGLPILKRNDPTTKNPLGSPSTDKEVLTELALTDNRAKLVHEYRDAEYCKSKFALSPLASLEYNGDGYTRPSHRVFGTYTGRMTISSKQGRGVAEKPTGIALHQWKRDPMFRDVIEPPPGYDLVEFDFAGQEFRWMAVESGDDQMLELCMPGEDAHAFMGAQVAGVEYRWLQQVAGDSSHPDYKNGKDKRQLGKVGNLSLQYRTSPPTLIRVAAVQYKLKLTETEARVIHGTYRTTYRMVPKYWKRQIEFARKFGYVKTLAGRRVQLGHSSTWKWTDENGVSQDWTWGHESTAINFPIQGIGADQKYLGMLCMHDLCQRHDARFYFELHDGIFFVVPKDKSQKFAEEGKLLLSNLPYERAWDIKLPIQFPVDGKIGPTWGQLKEFH